MNKKIISAVLATSMLLTVSTSNIYSISAFAEKDNKKTESKAEESDNCIVRFVLFVSDDFKEAQKDIQLTFKGNGEELTGTLGFSNDYSLNIALKKYVSYELTFSGDLSGYEILGADKYVYFEEDSTVNLTMLGATEQAQPQDVVTEQVSGEMTEEQRIVSEYVSKLSEFVENNRDFYDAYIKYFTSTAKNYTKKTGEYYNIETWKSLSNFEQVLFWALYSYPLRMFENYELMEVDDIKKDSVVASDYELGGKYKEFEDININYLWSYQLEQTKVLGVVPDYFTVYMDMKNGKVSVPVEESVTESHTEEKETVTSIITTTAAQTETVTTTKNAKKEEVKKIAKETGKGIANTFKSSIITISLLVIAACGIVITRIIAKKKRNTAYELDDE